MKKVYIVLQIYVGESAEVVKVFSARKKAEQYLNLCNKENKLKNYTSLEIS